MGITITTGQQEHQSLEIKATTIAEVNLTSYPVPGGLGQELERSYGPPARPGVGARRAVRKFPKTLKTLGES